jgi:hypothetical protein
VETEAAVDTTGTALVQAETIMPAIAVPDEAVSLDAPDEPSLVAEQARAVLDADDESILMDEIMRLIVERDSLYEQISELKAQNAALSAAALDAEYYKNRSEELETEVSRLEGELAQKETALVEAEAALAVSGGDRTAIDALIADKNVAIAERQAAVASGETAIAERNAAIELRDAAIATRDAAETIARAAEAAKAEADAARKEAETALATALASGAIIRDTGGSGYLSGWALDVGKFTRNVRTGFEASAARMGSWKIDGQTASQTDASQYFSRLELPLAQSKAATLYRFKARSTGKGWIGLGLHIFVDDIKKRRGYGEGKSLLVWFTRDKDARGDDATYLQLYRSDNDVVMERMFDAELEDGMAAWRLVEVVYDPVAEYIAISVDGTLRAVYRTFFGRDSGATVSLRTLGGGNSFQDFSAWTE